MARKIPPQPWRSRKPPEVTDSGGEPLARVGYASIRRVLDTPGSITAHGKNDYAMVFCGGLGIGIVRHGARPRSAKFSLFGCYPAREVTGVGPEGRDAMIKRFLSLFKRRASHAWPAELLDEYERSHLEESKRKRQ